MSEHRRSQRSTPISTLTSTASTRVGSPRAHGLHRAAAHAASALRERDRSVPPQTPGGPLGARPGEEPWVTKRQLADHLQVTPRWIELQHPQGLPHLRRGGIVRYRISDVEAWLLAGSASGGV
jgi:hypothetical protein